jgi:cytochrome c oxidase assembly protein subunit 15
MVNKQILAKIIQLAMVLAWCVLMLGAYTRLTDAGLGCPDWPGCYGHLVMPSVDVAKQSYPDAFIESNKAWTEMAHRYLAGSLLLSILSILALLQFKPSFRHLISKKLQLFLLFLMGFQAALGMWTVTLKLLPVVVMGHLLGGFLIFSCLAAMRGQLLEKVKTQLPCLKKYVFMGMVLAFIQIALGGWVSSNYAGISCIGFPMCNGQWVPALNFHDAFDFFRQIGPNYQGGLLDIDARMTIQWVHRLGALIVFAYWSFLISVMFIKVKNVSIRGILVILAILMIFQIILGVINVIFMLPLTSAVLHNGIGALFLGCIVILLNKLDRE